MDQDEADSIWDRRIADQDSTFLRKSDMVKCGSKNKEIKRSETDYPVNGGCHPLADPVIWCLKLTVAIGRFGIPTIVVVALPGGCTEWSNERAEGKYQCDSFLNFCIVTMSMGLSYTCVSSPSEY